MFVISQTPALLCACGLIKLETPEFNYRVDNLLHSTVYHERHMSGEVNPENRKLQGMQIGSIGPSCDKAFNKVIIANA